MDLTMNHFADDNELLEAVRNTEYVWVRNSYFDFSSNDVVKVNIANNTVRLELDNMDKITFQYSDYDVTKKWVDFYNGDMILSLEII